MSRLFDNDSIDASASGYASVERDRWHLVIIQGYYDDSGSDAASPVYMLAGTVSSVERWKRFSDEWRDELSREPSIEYFKMSEAQPLKGQFEGWPAALRDQKVFVLSEILDKHMLLFIESYLYRDQFDRLIKNKIPVGTFTDPYFLCFYHIVVAIAELHGSFFECEAEFIFDQHGAIGTDAVGWWELAKTQIPPKFAKYLVNQPVFKDDKRVLPLQAADLYAWHARNSRLEKGDQSTRTLAIMKMFSGKQRKVLHWDYFTLCELSDAMFKVNDFYKNACGPKATP
jgi:hypothetical protein